MLVEGTQQLVPTSGEAIQILEKRNVRRSKKTASIPYRALKALTLPIFIQITKYFKQVFAQ